MNSISVERWETTLKVVKSNMSYNDDLVLTVKRYSYADGWRQWTFLFTVPDEMLTGWSFGELKKYYAKRLSKVAEDSTGLSMSVQGLEKDLGTVLVKPGEVVERKFFIPATNHYADTFNKATEQLKYSVDHTAQGMAGMVNFNGAKEAASNVAYTAWKLPGVNTKVQCPCDVEKCLYKGLKGATVYRIVQHLNDSIKWSREKIADWLDDLADRGEINIDFAVPDGEKLQFDRDAVNLL